MVFVSIVIGVLGFYLITTSKSGKNSQQENYNRRRLEKLKINGEKIILTIDNCEIRENNYYEEEIKDSYSRIEIIDTLVDPNRNYKENYIEQSAIIYYDRSDKKFRMTSQTFQLNAGVLETYIENKKVILYVDRFDRSNYIFELED